MFWKLLWKIVWKPPNFIGWRSSRLKCDHRTSIGFSETDIGDKFGLKLHQKQTERISEKPGNEKILQNKTLLPGRQLPIEWSHSREISFGENSKLERKRSTSKKGFSYEVSDRSLQDDQITETGKCQRFRSRKHHLSVLRGKQARKRAYRRWKGLKYFQDWLTDEIAAPHHEELSESDFTQIGSVEPKILMKESFWLIWSRESNDSVLDLIPLINGNSPKVVWLKSVQ